MKKLLFVFMSIVLVLSFVMPVAADAHEKEVETYASVDGTGTPPEIMAIAITPDSDTSKPGTQVVPNFGSLEGPTGKTEVCIWVVASQAGGIQNISRVYLKVFEPVTYNDRCGGDMQEKFQIESLARYEGGCAVDPNSASDPVWGPIVSTYNAGTLQFCNDYDLEDVRARIGCGKGAALYRYCFEYDTHQWGGFYTARPTAVNVSGLTGSCTVPFEIASIVGLATDFDEVDYTDMGRDLVPGQSVVVPGDQNVLTPEYPTVRNIGNDPAILSLENTRLVNANGKWLDQFDAILGNLPNTMEVPVYMAGEVVTFDQEDVWLMPCTPTQLDLSLHAPLGTEQGIYEGSMYLEVGHAPVEGSGTGTWCDLPFPNGTAS